MQRLRRDDGDVRQSDCRSGAPRVAGSRYVNAFMKRPTKVRWRLCAGGVALRRHRIHRSDGIIVLEQLVLRAIHVQREFTGLGVWLAAGEILHLALPPIAFCTTGEGQIGLLKACANSLWAIPRLISFARRWLMAWHLSSSSRW